MDYSQEKSLEILGKTPVVLKTLLTGLHNDWIMNNEGAETFSPYDVVGHLIHGEKTDWPGRIKRILEFATTKPFDTFDRFAMYEESKGKTLNELLDEFDSVRKQNIIWFTSLLLTENDLDKKACIQNWVKLHYAIFSPHG